MTKEFSLKRDDYVSIFVTTVSSLSPVIHPGLIAPAKHSSTTQVETWRVTKTLAEICDKSKKPEGNIFFRLIERLGGGKVILHTFGLVRIGLYWDVKHTQIEVRHFVTEDGGFFTPSFLRQRELQETIQEIVKDDDNIPPVSEYQVIIPERDTVVWFDIFRLIGCINTPKGDAMLHWNEVITGNIDDIKPGAKVIYDLEPSSQSFPWKAKNVRILPLAN